MLIGYRRGQGSIILRVKILNSSVSTGAGLTGLSSTSSGLIISTIADNEATATAYTVAASNVETITTLGTYAAPTSGKCRFKEVDATNHKGVYEIQIADARFNVSNAKSLLVSVSGATNAAETDVVIPLRDLDPFDAVAGGLSRLDAAVSSRMATYTQPTGFLAATFPTTVSSLTAAGVRTELTTELGRIDVAVSSRLATASYTTPPTAAANASAVRTELTTELSRIDVATSTRLASSAYTTPPTVGAIADAVWDEPLADHLASGSTGAGLNAAGSAGDPWSTSLPGAYGSGTAGFILGTNLNATVSSRLATSGYTTPPTAGIVADAVWDEAYAGHTTAGSFGKLMDTLRKANYVTDGSVAAGGTPTTTSFRTNLTAADGTYDNQTLLFISGALAGESVPILTYAQTNGLITTQDALTVAPTAADEFVILPDHVHSVAEIADGVHDEAVEGSETLRQAIRLIRAALVGRLAGAATTTVTMRDAANTKNRITATVTADGNRTDVTTDAT